MTFLTPGAEHDFLSSIVLLLLYAEIHYKFKGIYSRLIQKAPEIIADVPYRLEPGQTLPVLLFIKCADAYPIRLHRLVVTISQMEGTRSFEFELENLRISQSEWSEVYEIPRQALSKGKILVDVFLTFSLNGKELTIKNDNYKQTTHEPFEVLVAEHKLPKATGWLAGDLHCHTNYTHDQVEFGAPLAATRTMAKAAGLDFFCATDHSYDLDDCPNDFLKQDPELPKWRALWREIQELNDSDADFIIVPGEEVSVGNCQGRNVHFLVLNNPEFLPGDGDGAEKWLRTRPTTSIETALDRCNSNSASFAAHPMVKPSLLEKLLVGRGHWKQQDFGHEGLHGLQIWNGTERGFEEGKRAWIELLLKGKRAFVIAGNDAHGNFNRYRQIGIPFLTMSEHHDHVFGKVRTLVRLPNRPTVDNLLHAIKSGNMVITNGPIVTMKARSKAGNSVECGGQISGAEFRVDLVCKSTPEFGEIQNLQLVWADSATRCEKKLNISPKAKFEFNTSHTFAEGQTPIYVRAEAFSSVNGKVFRCLTNPIWVNHDLSSI